MQGSSFWKTVAIVGVIGIGSLAILEVQNQLGRKNLAGNGPSSEELAEMVANSTGDSAVTPDVVDNDFDKMMAAIDAGGAPPFSGSEPPLYDPSTVDQGFVNSEPVAAQRNTPPVNNNVTTTGLEQGGNPFASQSAGQTVSANYSQDASTHVEPVGFVTEETSASPSHEVNPFRRDGVSSPSTEQPESPFSLFPNDSSSTGSESTIPVAQESSLPANPKATNSTQFFSSGETDGSESLPSEFASDEQKTTQFYESDSSQLRPTPTLEGDVSAFESDSMSLPRNTPLAPQMEQTPDHFPAFPGAGEATPSAAQKNFDNGIFQEDDPRQDLVPTPQNIQTQPQTQAREFPEPNDFIEFGAQDTTPTPKDALPFAEDVDGGNSSSPFSIQELDDSGRHRIPDSGPSLDEYPLSEDLLNEDPFPEYRLPRDSQSSDDLLRSEFDSNPQLTIPEPTRRSQPDFGDAPGFDETPGFDDTPAFDDGSREFRAPRIDDRRQYPQPQSLQDRRFDDGSSIDDGLREFHSTPRTDNQRFTPDYDSGNRTLDSKPPMDGTRPADYDLSDRRDRGEISTVSGVMSPNLVLKKTAPENATVGVPLQYKIYVRNEGDATAYDIVVEDDMPSGATVERARPKPQVDRNQKRMVWKFDQLQPNQSKEIVVELTPTGEGTLDGVATVKFKSRVRATTVITAPRLHIDMKGPKEVKLGDEIAYRYVVTNQGTGEARDVWVRTVLPTDGGLKHPAGPDLEYEIGSMAPGQQREILLTVIAGEPGTHGAEATVSGAGGAKDSAAWRTNIIGSQLQIVRRGPKRRFVGRPAAYENIVSNETDFDAMDARIVEVIPRGMDFKTANKGGQYDPQNRSVTWRIKRLRPGQQEQLQIELVPTNAGQLESAVTIFENAGLQGENYVSTTVVEDLHNVGAKLSQLDGPVEVGETFGFTIAIDNRGTAVATDVHLAVEVPQEIEVVGAGSQTVKARHLNGQKYVPKETVGPGNRTDIDRRVGGQIQYDVIVRINPNERQTFELKLRGVEPVRNGLVSAKIQYRQMENPLVVSESVTVYRDDF